MKRCFVSIGFAAAVLSMANIASAQGRGGGPKPKPATPHATTTPTHGATPAAHGATPHAQAPVSATHGQSATHAATAKPAHAPVKTTTAVKAKPAAPTTVTASAKTSTNTKKTTASATTATGTTGATPLTPVQQKLQRNTNLAAKLQGRLPEGTDLMKAVAGFKNLGQFVAAVNVSNNLNLNFTQLKTKMVIQDMSLGQAIQSLKPASSATVEAQRAEYDARVMIYDSEQVPSAEKPAAKKSATDGRQ
jgi:hypothetical protein